MDPTPITSPEKWLLASWNLCSALISTAGNITVLLATLKYSSIKLDAVSVILITNTALADLGFTFTCIIPSTLYILAQRQIFPHIISSFFNLADEVFLCADIYLLCAMNISKLTNELLTP